MNVLRRHALIVIVLFTALGCSTENPLGPSDEIEIPEGYTLIWSDEFSGTAIDSNNWQYELGDGTDYGLSAGWGNNELQLYSDLELYSGTKKDGGLDVAFITADKTANGYVSAKLTTQSKIEILYGRIDVRLKLPKGQGIWPAFWMLGTNIDEISWPGCGEIDIVELLGHQPEKIYSTLHFTNGENKHEEIQASEILTGTDFSDEYHTFSLSWTPSIMTMSLDGEQYQEIGIREDMKEFLRSFYLIMNMAVGGNWPGNPDETTVFPQTMYVDYVRVFEKTDFEAPEPPVLVPEEETIGQLVEPGLAQHAISDGFSVLGNATVKAWGGGGEPIITSSEIAIDGDSSVVFDFQGGAWGGAYFELSDSKNLSAYGTLKFSLKKTAEFDDVEIKLESPATNAAVFLKNYTGTEATDGFTEYSIPLSDFAELDLTQIHIPLSLWNPQNNSGEFYAGEVIIDNLHFTN